MLDRLRVARVLGLTRLRDLYRGYKYGWMGAIHGYVTTRTMQTLFDVGFFEELEARGRINVDAFAREKGLDAHVLGVLCNSLYAQRVLRREGDDYVFGSRGVPLAQVSRGWFDGISGYREIYDNLEGVLRRECVYGEDVYRRTDLVAQGSGEAESWIYFPLAIHMIVDGGYRRVLDLGCGDGTFLRHLCAETSVEGFGIDLAPEAIAAAIAATEAAGLSERIRYAVGDVTQLEQTPPAFQDVEIATTFFVLHEILWQGRQAAVDVLKGYRRLFPQIPLLLFEIIRPTDEAMRRRPGMMVQYLVQHELSHQKLVGRDDLYGIFHEAGFADIDEWYIDAVRTSIFTLR